MTAIDRVAPYLGREELRERLGDALAAAAEGRGAFIVLRGLPGSGTTATAQWLTGAADAGAIGVRWGTFADGLRGRPYGGLADLLDAHASAVSSGVLARELGPGAPSLARIAPALRASLPGIPPPAPLAAADEHLRLLDAYAAWLGRATSERPLLLVLDDFQWADSDAVALMEHVVAHVGERRALLLATWSDHRETAGRLPASRLLGEARVLEVGGLDKGATGALLARVAGRPVSMAALDLIQQASNGQPLAAMELYRHLREEGRVGRIGGDDVPTAHEVPRRLEDIVAWRAARLAPESRSALMALACFHDGARAAMLAPVAGLTRMRVAQALEGPVSADLVRTSEAGGRYAVAHEALRRALLGQLEPALLSRALRRAAEALQAEAGPDSRAIAPLLADLYTRSATEPGAVSGLRHCLIAAEQARASAAYGRAAQVLAAAEALLAPSDASARIDLQRRLLEAWADAGDAEATLASAAKVAPRAGSSRMAAVDVQPIVHAARALRAWGDADAVAELVAMARRATGTAAGERIGRLDPAAARLELLGEQWEPGGGEQPATFWRQVDEIVEGAVLRDGDELDRADLFAPQRRRTHEQTVALLTLSREWRRPASLLAALRGASADLSTRLGRYREAAAWAEQYLSAAERYGSPRDTTRALLFGARIRAVLGELGAAADLLARAEEVVERTGDAADVGDELVLARLTLAHYADGDWRGLVEQATQRVAAGARPAGLLLVGETALAHARLGDEGQARPRIDSTLDGAERWPPLTFLRDEALLVALTAAWELGWAASIVRARTLVAHCATEGVGGNHAATPELALARLAALAARTDEARTEFAAARARLDAAGMRPLRAIVDHDEGIALAGSDAGSATTLLRAAIDAFANLGMDGWRSRSERLLEVGFDAAAQPGGRLHFSYPAGLSRREVELVRLLSGGASLNDAATSLEIDPGTADRHLVAALTKLGGDDLSDLPRLARRHGLGGGV